MAFSFHINASKAASSAQGHGTTNSIFEADGSIRDWHTTPAKTPQTTTTTTDRSLSFGSVTRTPSATDEPSRSDLPREHTVSKAVPGVQTFRYPTDRTTLVPGYDLHQPRHQSEEVQTPGGTSEAVPNRLPPGPNGRMGFAEDVPPVSPVPVGTSSGGFSDTMRHHQLSTAARRCDRTDSHTEDHTHQRGKVHGMETNRTLIRQRREPRNSIRSVRPVSGMVSTTRLSGRHSDGRWKTFVTSWANSALLGDATTDSSTLPLRTETASQREEVQGIVAAPTRDIRRSNHRTSDDDLLHTAIKRRKTSRISGDDSTQIPLRRESDTEGMGQLGIPTALPHSVLADPFDYPTTDRTPISRADPPSSSGTLSTQRVASTHTHTKPPGTRGDESPTPTQDHGRFLPANPTSSNGNHSRHRDDGRGRPNQTASTTNPSSPGIPNQGTTLTLAHQHGASRPSGHGHSSTPTLTTATQCPTDETTHTGDRQHCDTGELTETRIKNIHGSTIDSVVSRSPSTESPDHTGSSTKSSDGPSNPLRLDGSMDSNTSHPGVGITTTTDPTSDSPADRTTTQMGTGHRHVRMLQHSPNQTLCISLHRSQSNDDRRNGDTVDTTSGHGPSLHAPTRNLDSTSGRTDQNRESTGHTDNTIVRDGSAVLGRLDTTDSDRCHHTSSAEQLCGTRWHTAQSREGNTTVHTGYVEFVASQFQHDGITESTQLAEHIFSDYAHGRTGADRQNKKGWQAFAAYCNRDRPTQTVSWATLRSGFAAHLISEGRLSFLNTSQTAINVVLQTAFHDSVLFQRKLRGATKRLSSAAKDHNGLKAECAMDLQLVHKMIKQQITAVGSIAQLPEGQLRTAADFFIRLATAGRTNTSHAILDGAFIFPPNCTKWDDVPIGESISFRLMGTKAGNLSHVDNERDKLRRRSAADRKSGFNSSIISITRACAPEHLAPLDYFQLMDEYIQRVSKMTARPLHSVAMDSRDGQGPAIRQLPRLFVASTTSATYRNKEIKPATLNASLNRLLIKAGAISQEQSQKGELIRHTVISTVLHFCNMHAIAESDSANVSSIRSELHARTKHSQSVAESTYQLHLLPVHKERLKLLAPNDSLDHLLYRI